MCLYPASLRAYSTALMTSSGLDCQVPDADVQVVPSEPTLDDPHVPNPIDGISAPLLSLIFGMSAIVFCEGELRGQVGSMDCYIARIVVGSDTVFLLFRSICIPPDGPKRPAGLSITRAFAWVVE